MEADPLSPDERRVFDELANVIREELQVCVVIGRFDHPDGVQVTADLLADAVWGGFELRRRPDSQARLIDRR
jgi:hypothetical protein